MLRFKQYISLAESSTKAAKEMEYVLVDAAGGDSGNTEYTNLKPYAIKNNFDSPLDLGKTILDKVSSKLTLDGTARMSVSADVSDKWFGTNKTPKTDIWIAGNKISLKKGASQIMSGGPDESISTFHAALKAIGGNFDKDLLLLANDVETGIKKLLPSYKSEQMGGIDMQKYGGTVFQNTKMKTGPIATTTKIKGSKGYGKLDKDKILRTANSLNKTLTKQFTELFTGNQKFKKEFVFEAMTGKVKFGGNEGTADYFLVVDFDGSAEYHEVKNSKAPYVTKILSKVKPDVKFKSTAVTKTKKGIKSKTGYYRFWSTVGLVYSAAVKANNEAYDLVNSGELEYLSEGFFDAIKRAWNKFKTFVKNLIEKVQKWIKQSANNMMEFLELKPDIKFNNEIVW